MATLKKSIGEYPYRSAIGLKAKLRRRNIRYAELSDLLKQIADGETRSPDAIRQTIYRGSFKNAFYLKCLDVLGVKPPIAALDLKEKILKNGLTYKELSEKLKTVGVEKSESAIAKALSRNKLPDDLLTGCNKVLRP